MILTPLTLADAPHVQRLFERCSEFWALIELPMPPAEEELTSIAPGKTLDDTFNFGAFDGDRLIAFLSMARDYPKESEWWLGLLLLDPAARSRGLGPQIHRELLDWIAAQGGTKLWIAVQTQNVAAERFWRRTGYVEHSRQPYGTGTVILMWIEVQP
ncbi:MAG TPA: GNAT family N-acetyltransferase [Thermoanaerobaculia bacterium]|nr:GNAT family N-acetyltransferase [Thermoanaerobaculia bacterium]